MKKTNRMRFLAFLLAVLMCCPLLPQNVSAQPQAVSENAIESETALAAETKTATLTVPKGAKAQMGTLTKSYVYDELTPKYAVSENSDGTFCYTYDVTNIKSCYYKVSKEGGVTYWNYVTIGAANDYVVTDADLYTGDESRNPDTVIDDFSENKYDVGDLYLNINPQGYLALEAGESYTLEAFRNWQIIEGTSNAKIAEPDFHYPVLDANGQPSDEVIKISTLSQNSSTARVQAVGKGTAIVLVTYDAVTSKVAYGKAKDGSSGTFFSAIWPENTGVFVVSVGRDGSDISTGMLLNAGKNDSTVKLSGDKIDSELDVLYYQKGQEGAAYTFTPEEGVTVDVLRPSYQNGKLTFMGGFTAADVIKNTDDSYTVNALPQGRSIIRVTKNGISTYQVVTAKEVELTLSYTNAKGEEIEADMVNPGDTVTVSFDRLYIPANKFAGIYNMFGTVCLYDSTGTEYKSTPKQYDFAYAKEAQSVTVTIPEDFKEDEFVLTGTVFEGKGASAWSGFGNPYGDHRNTNHTIGKNPNFTAQVQNAYLAQLPEVRIPMHKPSVTVSVEKFTVGQGYSVKPVTVEIQEGDTVSKVTAQVLDAQFKEIENPYIYEGNVEDGFYITAIYDTNTKIEIPNYILEKIKPLGERAKENYLSAMDYSNMSGWMYVLNNQMAQTGASEQTVSDNDVIRWQYTLYNYGSDIVTDTGWGSPVLKTLADKDALTAAIAKINRDKEAYLIQDAENENRYNYAMAVLTRIDSAQENVDAASDILKNGHSLSENQLAEAAEYKKAEEERNKKPQLPSDDENKDNGNNNTGGNNSGNTNNDGNDKGNETNTAAQKQPQQIEAADMQIPLSKSAKALGAKAQGTLTYSLSNKNISISKTGKITARKIGKTTVTIQAAQTEQYESATVQIVVTVVPVQMKKPTAAAKAAQQLKITWKQDKNVTGYQITYSTSKKFTKKTTHTAAVKGNKTLSKTLKGLKDGKKYYVKIRSYKKVGTKTYYGSYSKVISKKVK